MDTGKEYIGMCLGAWGDIGMLSMDGCPNLFISDDYKEWISPFDLGGDEINSSIIGQLYRQDQLQGVVIPNNYDPIAKQHMFAKFCSSQQGVWDNTGEYKSREILWLAFVMWEKFNKKWDGSEWVT